ncbi:MAG: hypothetical protein Q4D12_05110 [Bacteroidales bacterium]|nr:hypothetical protein [Bacteroidales bacterium]
MEQNRERLMAVSRTGLVAKNKEEFGKLIDRDFSQNSVATLKRLSDFNVNAIFHELCHVVFQETELSLENLLDDYQQTSNRFSEYGLSKWFKKNTKEFTERAFILLDFILFHDAEWEIDRDTEWDELLEEADSHLDLKLALLLALGILPHYSGKGKVAEQPLDAFLTFMENYIIREGCYFFQKKEYASLLLKDSCSLSDRLKAIAILYHFCDVTRKSLSPELSREAIANTVFFESVGINRSEEFPTLWWDEKHPHLFWFFQNLSNSYYLYKCHIRQHTYTRYTLFLGSEFGISTARIYHPKYIEPLLEMKPVEQYSAFSSWNASFDKDGMTNMIHFTDIRQLNSKWAWTEDLDNLQLKRLSSQNQYFDYFCKKFRKTDKGWKLKDSYSNAFPATDYQFHLSLYAITRDNILVQDVEEIDGETTLINNKFFHVDREWVDQDIQLTDQVGIILLPACSPLPTHKYLALDYRGVYFPIINDEVIFNH